MERKVPKYEYHKIRERKVKTLTRNWRYHCRKGTRKLYQNISTGTAVFINQKRSNVCEHTTKMVSLENLWKVPLGGARGMGGGKLSEVNARTESRRQNKLVGKFKMAASDLVSVRGQVTESTLTFQQELKGRWWDLVWIATESAKSSGLLEEDQWPFILVDRLFLVSPT